VSCEVSVVYIAFPPSRILGSEMVEFLKEVSDYNDACTIVITIVC